MNRKAVVLGLGLSIIGVAGICYATKTKSDKQSQEFERGYESYTQVVEEPVTNESYSEQVEMGSEDSADVEEEPEQEVIKGYEDYQESIKNIDNVSEVASIKYDPAYELTYDADISESVCMLFMEDEGTGAVITSIISQLAKRDGNVVEDYTVDITTGALWDGKDWYYEVFHKPTGKAYKIVYYSDAVSKGGYLVE